MATLKDIKLRMGSIKNTQHITKAMKMVAASKMKRAENRISNARPYKEKLERLVVNLSSGIEDSAHPLLEKREGGKALVLLVTSDKGLCGGLNSNLCKQLNLFLLQPDQPFELREILAFGKKGQEFFKSRNLEVAETIKDLKEQEQFDAVGPMVKRLIEEYAKGEINHLFLAYNRFKNVISQEVQIRQVLPIKPPESEGMEESLEFIFEPDKLDLLSSILPQYVENQVFTALLDSHACEHASRMTAMDAATKNAGEMLAKLSLQYNRARQALITTELTEIISGAESI
ncbi:MAG: ATP synthase F1 subunit gamma [Deltaproteobacteria bacterium]|nr:ATP synthase F1 subunit gamma [Deltaproteobacteria bacterium]